MRGSASARRGARGPGSAGGGRAGWRRAPSRVTWRGRASGGRRRAVLTLAAGRSERSAAQRSRPGPARPHHGGQAAHPHGQREAQQEHHPARQRRQDLEDGPGGEGVGRAVAAGAVHLRGVRISHLPDHPEHQDGHVKAPPAATAAPRGPRRTVPRARPAPAPPQPLRDDARRRPCLIPGPLTSHSEFSSPCHSALKSTTCIKQ